MEGLQQFVICFALPCVLFNSCLTSTFGTEALTSMTLLVPLLLVSTLLSFRVSAVILFTIGYNFSLSAGGSRRRVLTVTAAHCGAFLGSVP